MWFYVVQPHAQGFQCRLLNPLFGQGMAFFVNPFRYIYGISSKISPCRD